VGVVGVRLCFLHDPSPLPLPQGGGDCQRRARSCGRSYRRALVVPPALQDEILSGQRNVPRELQHQIVGVVVVGVGHHDRAPPAK